MLVRNALSCLLAGVFVACATSVPVSGQSTSTVLNKISAPSTPIASTSGYDKPPKDILDVMLAPLSPQPIVSPTQDTIMLLSWQNYAPISRVATPFLRLAGVRVVGALNAIPASSYFFWTGLSKPKSAVGDWQRSSNRLLILAGLPDGHAHRFRDTFSVSSCSLAWRLSASRFSWCIRVCESPRSITRPGFVRFRNSWRPMFGALGRLLNQNEGYAGGTRKTTRV